jgi:hypothetical protein
MKIGRSTYFGKYEKPNCARRLRDRVGLSRRGILFFNLFISEYGKHCEFPFHFFVELFYILMYLFMSSAFLTEKWKVKMILELTPKIKFQKV